MKTLDEVIDCMERCSKPHFDCNGCPYEDEEAECGCLPEERDADVLHYLKHLQEYYEMSETHDYSRLKPYNPPLTWDELKQMFHKPVWIETKTKKTWVIINDFDGLTPNNENVNVIHTSHNGAKCSHFAKHLMGQTWQAYRKEK